MAARVVLVLFAVLSLASACATAPGSSGVTEPAESDTSAAPPAEEPAAEQPTTDQVSVGEGPVGLTVDPDGGAVWVVSARAETVSRIPPGATEPDLVIDVPGVPLRAVAAYGAIWVTAFHGNELVRIDPAAGKVTDRISTGAGPEGLVAAFGAIWLVAQDVGRLLRVDPVRRKVTERLDIGVGARLVTAGDRWLYVSHYAEGRVLRVDPGSGEISRSQEICQGPQGMAVEHGRVWVACTVDEVVLVLDEETLQELARLNVPGAPDPVTLAPDGQVLVLSQAGPTLVTIDPQRREVGGTELLAAEDQLYDAANLDLVVAGGEVWASSFFGDAVLHVPLLTSQSR
jgi:DNA-binding beta-propeller fold protein YncE